ncbi:PREDICTED: leucine-rich repeat-containing protein 20 isoform X3 [Pterocles gutturalis]|uniref:leucine-rich repeat-containing protein 20 isoform X3 n=1 Tax=Pterocles gutturalis TaxID=240206 RepID=UPI0005287C76|nr:PREDICTED: leucine-rich repeat-containing protein 20 isoform X3 [Pterocles gutturalis]
MQKRMGEAVARVARKVNDTVENKTDSLDLANCKLMTFPVGIYKAMRSVTEGIHHISLANNELKSLTSRFITTFSQLREVPVEKLASMASLRSLNLRENPVGPEVRLLVRPLVPFDLLLSPEEPVPKA